MTTRRTPRDAPWRRCRDVDDVEHIRWRVVIGGGHSVQLPARVAPCLRVPFYKEKKGRRGSHAVNLMNKLQLYSTPSSTVPESQEGEEGVTP